MLARGTPSYSGAYAQRQQQQATPLPPAPRSPPPPPPAPPLPSPPTRLLTDRSSYIAYLESQLERVSAACLSVSIYEERLQQTVSAVRLLEERVLSVARLVNVTQQFAEQQEAAQREGVAELARRLAAVEGQVAVLARPQADLAARLAAVGSEVDAKLEAHRSSAAEQLERTAEALRQGLDAACHEAHLRLGEQASQAVGRLDELERKLRALDEYAHAGNAAAQVASLVARLGSVEDSLGHLAQDSAGVKRVLGSVEGAVGQLRTAVVALELRPPVEGVGGLQQDTLQWLARAREALRGEVQSVLVQSQQLAAGIEGAQQAAVQQPASPQKEAATQVLSGLQGALQGEVGHELQALQLADCFLANVKSQLAQSPRPVAVPQQQQAAVPVAVPQQQQQQQCSAAAAAQAPASTAAQQHSSQDTTAAAAAAAAMQAGRPAAGAWTIAAGPPIGSTTAAAAAPQLPLQQWALTAPACASPGPMLLRVAVPEAQQPLLAAQPPCCPSWLGYSAPGGHPAGLCGEPQLQQGGAAAGAGSNTNSAGLRGSLGHVESQLQSVCALLQHDGGGTSGAAADYPSLDDDAAPRVLDHVGTLKQQLGGSTGGGTLGAAPLKKAWLPGGGIKPALASAKAAAASRSTSLRPGSSAQAAKVAEDRRWRLQQLYAELRS